MKYFPFKFEKNYQKELAVLVVMSLIAIIFLLVYRQSLPPQVPLLFLVNDDAQSLLPSIYLLFLPLYALLATLINNFLVSKIQNSFFENLVHYFNLCMIISLLYTLIKIVQLVS